MGLIRSLEGQTAIITGGASGIGKATAKLLSEADAEVYILDIDEAGQNVADEIGHRATFIPCDMGNIKEVDRAYDRVSELGGEIDILVNNVGIWIPGGDILDMEQDTIQKMENVNVKGPFHLTRLVMNGMKIKGREGCVTFVASTQAHIIDGAPTIYNVQKNTILGMTKALAVAGGPLGIRVNAVSPGAISTEGMGAAGAVGKERILAGNNKTPLGRRGTSEEVAEQIVSLCFTTYTNGAEIIVDGGFSSVAMAPSFELNDIHPKDPDITFLSD
jgi:NAD(P)-dependent dehydrogenase (short-subunit alcohol dehydrogenase family)